MVKNKAGQEQVDKLIDELKTSGKTFKYLEWTKQKEQAGNEKADIFRYINAFFINFVTYGTFLVTNQRWIIYIFILLFENIMLFAIFCYKIS